MGQRVTGCTQLNTEHSQNSNKTRPIYDITKQNNTLCQKPLVKHNFMALL